MAYLENSPQPLIEIYEKRSRHSGQFLIGGQQRQILGKLLSDKRMKRAWNGIRKSLKTNDDYAKWLKAVIESMRLARRGIVSPAARKECFDKIAKCALKLRKLIATPDKPPLNRSGYRGEFDVEIYGLAPENVAGIIGAAYAPLPMLTLVEVLNVLAEQARQEAHKPALSRRRSRLGYEDGDEKVAMVRTKARLFACSLDDELRKMKCQARRPAVIRAIASVI